MKELLVKVVDILKAAFNCVVTQISTLVSGLVNIIQQYMRTAMESLEAIFANVNSQLAAMGKGV